MEELYTVKEAAKLRLKCSETVVWGLIAKGELDSIRVGTKLRRIPATAIDAYIAKRKQEEEGGA